MSTITIIEGNSNDKDNTRLYMVKGEAGATISTITKTGTTGLVDTYTITLDDGRTQTFTVTNGKAISSVTKTGTQGLVDTYTITFNDNTTETFTVTNGYNPTATVTKSNGVATITLTDENGTTTANVNDGTTYEVPANGVIGWDSNNAIPAGYEEVNAYDIFNVYSTTEIRVGTWVDGKPLYRKVYSSSNTNSISLSDLDFDYINIVSSMLTISGYKRNPYYTGSTDYFRTLIDTSGQLIIETSGSAQDISNWTTILEYTKTTD